jgi:DNA mismatch repair protein MutL
MGKINVLSFEIANLIAAGEVVERPSSVLKELMENSIDSGATKIVAEIKKGGVALIRVTDNGCGIEKDDLPVALKRHATSKIKEREDLDGIITLGFRGEALAAISSVSQVTIITKTRESEVGYMLTSEGGNILDVSEVGTSDGTTVVVEDLFFNVPARRKFLKKDSTEAMNVAALVEKVALSRPDISIQLLIDGEEKFNTPGDGELKNAIRAIYGKNFASKLIEVKGKSEGIDVSGFIGRSDNVRKNRNLENVFINQRYVKSLTVQAALEKAFTSYIAPECFPVCTLFVNMNPGTVDVNVHPAKLEVKFSDERRVFEAVYYTVKTALEKEEYRPEMSLCGKSREYNPLGAFVPIGADTKGSQIKLYDGSSFTPADHSNRTARYEVDTRSKASVYTKRDYSDLDKPLSVSSGAEDRFKDRHYDSGLSPRSSASNLTPRESIDILRSFSEVKAPEVVPQTEQIPEYKYVGEAFD